MNKNEEWTVSKLAQMLSHLPQDARIKLLDADTNWTIPVFQVIFNTKDQTLWFEPCDYGDMINE